MKATVDVPAAFLAIPFTIILSFTAIVLALVL
jgi:hypothetical protein